jgi:hypothetical protein
MAFLLDVYLLGRHLWKHPSKLRVDADEGPEGTMFLGNVNYDTKGIVDNCTNQTKPRTRPCCRFPEIAIDSHTEPVAHTFEAWTPRQLPPLPGQGYGKMAFISALGNPGEGRNNFWHSSTLSTNSRNDTTAFWPYHSATLQLTLETGYEPGSTTDRAPSAAY